MKYQRHYNRRPQLTKDSLDKKISGVCSGVAKHYDLPSWGVRIAAVVLLFSFPVVTAVAYFTAAVLLPNRY